MDLVPVTTLMKLVPPQYDLKQQTKRTMASYGGQIEPLYLLVHLKICEHEHDDDEEEIWVELHSESLFGAGTVELAKRCGITHLATVCEVMRPTTTPKICGDHALIFIGDLTGCPRQIERDYGLIPNRVRPSNLGIDCLPMSYLTD